MKKQSKLFGALLKQLGGALDENEIQFERRCKSSTSCKWILFQDFLERSTRNMKLEVHTTMLHFSKLKKVEN